MTCRYVCTDPVLTWPNFVLFIRNLVSMIERGLASGQVVLVAAVSGGM